MENKETFRFFTSICICLFVTLSPLMAFGKGETEIKKVEKTDSWREVFDLTEKKPGKYNIYARAVDSGENAAIAGPYNIFIDPDSDLPIVGITNPVEEMHVVSNLNIVGTCVDDDAVQFVDIIIDGDTENVKRAEGSAFWSYYLDTTGMQDGVHTITVYGTDIYGVQGHPKTVPFHLDRDTPVTELQSHEMGMLVSGKVRLAGTVSDGNGIKRLSYSIDGGETFEEIKIVFDKKQNIYTFACDINTLEMKDGPSVCWFQSVDKQGSVGIYTFLFFVDNTKPEVRIVYPAPSATADGTPVPAPAVNGVFHVTGYAGDIIGLESLAWKFGKESGTFDIILGNPWWEKEFDVRNLNDKNIPLEIIATDIAGNVTSCKQVIAIDAESDRPVAEIFSPLPDNPYFDIPVLTGFVKDDDVPAFIKYKIDNAEEITVATAGAFSVPLENLAAGSHTVTVTPVDIYEVTGESVSATFIYAKNAPVVSVAEIFTPAAGKSGDITVPYRDGIELHPERKNILKINLESEIGLKSWSYEFSGLDPVSAVLSGKEKRVEIPVPAGAGYGSVPFTLRATDIYDRTTVFYGQVYITNLAKTRTNMQQAVNDFVAGEPFTALSPSLSVIVPAAGKKPEYQIDASIELGAFTAAGVPYAHGLELTLPSSAEKGADTLPVVITSTAPVDSVMYTLDDGQPSKLAVKKMNAEGTLYEAYITFPADTAATVHTFTVVAAIKNAGQIGTGGVVSVIRPAPAAGIADDESFVWTSHRPREDGTYLVENSTVVSGVYIPQTLRTLASASFEKNVSGVTVNVHENTVLVSFSADGTYNCGRLLLTDSEGAVYRAAPVTFVADSDVPAIEWTTPGDQEWVQNQVTVSGVCTDNSGIARLMYRVGTDGSYLPLASKTPRSNSFSFSEKIDLSSFPDGFIRIFIQAEDTHGKTAVFTRVLNKDTVAPVISVSVPTPDIAVNGENTISFFIHDDGNIQSAAYGLFAGGKKGIEWKDLTPGKYLTCHVGTAEYPLSDNMRFRFTDMAGNTTVQEVWPFVIDPESDLPVVEIHLPAENEVMRRDFVVSGVLYDDDKVSKVWYKIDNGAYQAIEGENSFVLPVALNSLTDNEHSITMYAEDIFGLKGREVVRNFRVSLEEPKAEVTSPSFEETCRQFITITGTASDKNGIAQVFVSLDNGISFNRADGTEKWSYTFDSRVIQDGTHVVFIKVWDKYDTVALYSSLINIDNTAPEIAVTLPVDNNKVSGDLFLSGHVNDNIKLEKLFVTVRSLAARPAAVPASLSHIEIDRDLVINKAVDISGLADGPYNIEFTAEDAAGNKTCASRNVILDKTPEEETVSILYPLSGEHVNGEFSLYGTVISKQKPDQLLLFVDGNNLMSQTPSPTGYFNFTLSPEYLGSGTHEFYVAALMPGGVTLIRSEVRKLEYTAAGPWITVDNFSMGDFAIDRPWIEGRSGYALSEEDAVALKAKETSKEERRALEEKTPALMEISFDNGKTFTALESARKWRYRLQTQDMAQGYHYIVFRAVMKNGETAVTRTIARIDKTAPFIKLIAPTEGAVFNENMVFSGLSSDDVSLESLELVLREGDKSSYELPGFIQGLFFDAHFWGATLYDVGLGLTFFDDNVKLQFQFGQFTQSQRNMFVQNPIRYGGTVLGMKLIANIAVIPFSYFLGPDWNWLSSSVSIGANFSWFGQTQKGEGQFLSAVILQLEFPRITFPKQKMFRTISFYTEGQLWFIPTDIQGTESLSISPYQPQIGCGVRVNLF